MEGRLRLELSSFGTGSAAFAKKLRRAREAAPGIQKHFVFSGDIIHCALERLFTA